ncbi:MAG: hypothetical protein NTY48_04790 [Candidatus Diapherotrites archaeon]|nr:hypothetical protein [Candidatus Diapherotrites archaeon]
MDEEVLVVRRDKLFGKNDEWAFSGFKNSKEFNLGEEAINSAEFRLRKVSNEKQKLPAENDPLYKQIIPYHFVTHKEKIFCYQRTTKAGENRLHNNYSIGIGGHINPFDGNEKTTKAQLIQSGAKREFDEEISYTGKRKTEITGFINDDTNDVGKVHLAMIVQVELENDGAKLKEDVYAKGSMQTIGEIKKHYIELENWSQILFDYLTKNK